jgi:hypothetical protein
MFFVASGAYLIPPSIDKPGLFGTLATKIGMLQVCNLEGQSK